MRTLLWLGLGAAAMYLLDPEQGRRRRAQARERMSKARGAVREQMSKARTAIRQRAPGGKLKREEQASQTPEGAQHLGR
jgi:hypothetical protein